MKGQAFDTFKLLIAAVVAIAILGILMAILGTIKPLGADAESVIEGQLQKANMYVGSTPSPVTASFTAGTRISGSSFLEKLGGDAEISFYCSDEILSICEPTEYGDGQGSVKITGTTGTRSLEVKACCVPDTAPIQCKVMVGRDELSC